MRYAIGIALISGAVAFGQTSPNHFQLPDKLTGPGTAPPSRFFTSLLNPAQPLPAAQSACAIPLLNALPAKRT